MLKVSPEDFLKFPRDDTKESTVELSSTSSHPVTYKVSTVYHFKILSIFECILCTYVCICEYLYILDTNYIT